MTDCALARLTSSRILAGVLLLVLALLAGLAVNPAASRAAACTPPVVNAVACENTLPGADPSTWQIDGSGDDTIQGFATSMSVNKGQTISFKIKSATSNYHIDILRLGYYGGDGAREIATNLTPTGPSNQPACQTFSATGLVDCGNWSVSRSWTVPSTAVSGVYIAHLVRNDTGGDSHITFVVRDEASTSDVVLQTSDSTWQAYNNYGGNSLYTCTVACPPGNPAGYQAAFKVSYNRPSNVVDPTSQLFTGAEYPMIRFLEANGYDVSYLSSADVGTRGQLLRNHKLFISSGHDEYWSASQRTSMEAARDAGVNLAFFSGNEGFWKTRWEPSADGSATPDRTLVSYKDTHFTTPQDPVEFTGTWRDPRFTTSAQNKPENALTGQSFVVNGGSAAMTVPFAYRQLRLWKNTAAANLTTGQTLTLAPQTLGAEWDEDADNGFRPAGQIKLSSTTVSNLEVFTDFGTTTTLGGTATHNLTMYKAPSGARVFATGTEQWAFGLDDSNRNATPADRNMQQATVNVFADMKAQPASLQSGLVAATATTDTTGPTATVSAPPATIADGTKVTLSGTAADTGGGVVAGVEVSTDGGSTWHPATGTSSWTYSWIAHGNPSTTIKARATDDSGNIGAATAGTSVNVSCPCSIWGQNVTPGSPDSGDTGSVEVGLKFTSDTFGSITGVRFYKSAANTGTHVGSLWTEGGTRLAQATFTGESASGWQSVTFATPVAVQPGTTYVASYNAPSGHYAATADYFWRDPAPGPNGGAIVDSAPLHAVRASTATGNGLFAYGPAGTFPNNSYKAANYWVDVLYAPIPAPGQVTGVSAVAAGSSSATVSWSAPASGGAVESYKITPFKAGVAQTPTTVTGTPPATSKKVTGLTTGSSYTFTVQAVNQSGAGTVSAASNAVTPLTPLAPTAPTGVSAQPASQSASVSWTEPASDGDSPITGYTITPYIGAAAQTTTHAGASATSATVPGLTNGTSYTFKVVATNAIGDSVASSASGAVTPRATIFDFATPTTVDSTDPNSVEVGVKFRASTDGLVTGVRFYKSAANTGTHVGSLWTAAGTRLAQATFTGESASGWQSVTFASPVAITANTTYVASYLAPSGHYSVTGGGFNSATNNGLLQGLATSTSPNGVYAYGSSGGFPVNTYNAANYWVDVLYALPVPGQVTGVSAVAAGSSSATVSWSAPASGGPVESYKITPFKAGVAQTPTTVTGTPPATSKRVTGLTTGSSYTFTVQAVNQSGAGTVSAASNAVTPQAPQAPSAPTGVSAQPATQSASVSWTEPANDGDSPITGYTITPYIGAAAQAATQVGASATSATVPGLTNGTSYTFKVVATNAIGDSVASSASGAVTPRATIFDFATPTTVDSTDPNSVELGVKFRASVDGNITGVRFYKSAANTGAHVGSLWTAAGTRLAQATFTGESASGWQSVTFASPVAITANTTYVASYLAPSGHYSVTGGGFNSATNNGLLQGLATSTSPNGVYAYGSSGGFPVNTYNAANYWVDVLYALPAPGQVTGVTATAGESSATVSWSAPAGGGPVESYKITPFKAGVAQTPTTVTGTPPATTKKVTGLTTGSSYTFTVQAVNQGGAGTVSAASNAVTPFSTAVPSAPTGVSAQPATQSASVSWTEPANDGGSPITGYTITPYIGGAAQAATQVGASATSATVLGLTNGTSYTFKVHATNAVGDSAASTASGEVTPRSTIFDFATPATVDAGDTGSVVLGVKFRADVDGFVTGVRFYKSAGNTGTHVGSLYSAVAQQLLGQATFTGESASGWQSVTFDTPVPVTANTTYLATYLAPNGHYSVTGAAFGSATVNPPLQALANSDSSNGVYVYSTVAALPFNNWNATNYWVDVLFSPGT